MVQSANSCGIDYYVNVICCVYVAARGVCHISEAVTGVGLPELARRFCLLSIQEMLIVWLSVDVANQYFLCVLSANCVNVRQMID